MNIRCNRVELQDPFIHSARTMGFPRNINWIRTMCERQLICYKGGKWMSSKKEDYLRFMENLIEALDRKYGQDWDMHIYSMFPDSNDNFYRDEVYYLFPVIRYKEALLKNSDGEEKRIKDMFMCFDVDYSSGNGFFYLRNPTGTRATFSLKDVKSKYVHSHLRSKTIESFTHTFELQTFCRGSGEINDFLATMAGEEADADYLEFFFVFLDTFISWESLEGGPHRVMKDTFDTSNRLLINPSESRLKSYFDLSMFYLKRLPNIRELDFIYHEGRYMIKDNQKFADLVSDTVKSSDILKGEFLCKKDLINGNYYAPKEKGENQRDSIKRKMDNVKIYDMPEPGLPYTVIQGEKIYFRILSEKPEEKEDLNQFGAHPKLREYVKQRIEQKLYEKAVRLSELVVQGEIDPYRRDNGQDQVSVQEHSEGGVVRDTVL